MNENLNNENGDLFDNAEQSNYYNNLSNYNETSSYKDEGKKSGTWWKILLVFIVIIVIIILLLKFCSDNNKKSMDAQYAELTSKICIAAETYANSNTNILGNKEPGRSSIIKFQTLSDSNLIEAQIENPYYDGGLFSKGIQPKYYSMDNSVRLMVMNDGKINCELVDNANDVTAPELRLNGDAEIVLAVGTEFEDPGYTATDDYDGDITSKVAISGNVDSTNAGTYELTYTVQDGAGNVTTKNRNVIFEKYADIEVSLGSINDGVPPQISLKGANPYCMVKGTKYVEPGAVATDNVDGNITDRIAVTNKVTGNLMGSFRVTYKVEDSVGNQAIAYRAVIVTTSCPEETEPENVVNNRPTISLIGKSAVTIGIGTEYIDLGATAYDKEDGDITSKIITDATGVNANSAGIYKVIYRVTDSGGLTATITRTVTVKADVSGNLVVRFTESKKNLELSVGEGDNSLISAPKAVNENGVQVSVSTKIEDYTTKKAVTSIDWSKEGKYRVIYTAVHGNGVLKQTKNMVVTITNGDVKISGKDNISIEVRRVNCNITEADLVKGGVTFETKGSSTPIVEIKNNKDIACTTGSYEVEVSARVNDGPVSTKIVKVSVIGKVAKEYTITLNGNGGTVPVSSISVNNGDTYSDLPTPTRAGYTFVGWFTGTAKHDQNKAYKDYPWLYYADTYADLYKEYGYNEAYLRYHYINYGEKEKRRKSQYEKTDTVSINNNITLYAGWTKVEPVKPPIVQAKEYTITLNGNGGNVSVSSIYVNNGDTYSDLPTPTRDGYTFVGWFTGTAKHDQNKAYKDYPWLYYADTYADLYKEYGYNEAYLRYHYINYGEKEKRRKSQYEKTDTVSINNNITLYAGWTKVEPLSPESPGKVIVTSNTANSSNVYNTNGVWVGGAVTSIELQFKATLPLNSGISYFEWSSDCSTAMRKLSKTGDTTGKLNWSTAGKSKVCIRAISEMGIAGAWSDPVNLLIDTNGPKIQFTHTWADGKNDWHNSSSLTLSYKASDSESGLSHFEYTYDDVKAKKAEDVVTYEESTGKLVVSENAEPTRPELFVYVRAVDRAGNKGEWTANPAYANMDTVKPKAPNLKIQKDNQVTVKVDVNAVDNVNTAKRGSGIQKFEFHVIDALNNLEVYSSNADAVKNKPLEGKTTFTMPLNRISETSYTLRAWSIDKAGNKSAESSEITVKVKTATLATSVKLKNGSKEIADGEACATNGLKINKSATLTATPVPSNSHEKVVTWVVEDNNIADINSDGKIVAKKVGTTKVTAQIGEVSKSCVLNVIE